MEKFNFSYDKKNDDLFLFSSHSKSKGSIELGDLILDYNSEKELVGIQFMNASRLLKDLAIEDCPSIKNVLNNLEDCKVKIISKSNLLIIKIHLFSDINEISSIISLPSIKEHSPALAYV